MISPTGGINGTAYTPPNMSPIKKERVEVDSSYIPATIDIRTRNPEMTVDWDRMREELGFLKPYAQMKEIQNISEQNAAEGISERVQAGLRARSIHKEKGNVFGRIAFQEFIADRKKEIRLDAAPKHGVKIDIRIFPPEITVDTNVKGGANIL